VAQREEITILRRREVQARTGLPSSSLYALIAKGQFPGPIPLSRRRVGWVSTEVDGWLRDRIAERGVIRAASKSSAPSGRR
jgi:prophage regulatory protein